MKTILATVAAAALFAAPAVAGGLGLGNAGKNGNSTTYSSAKLKVDLGGTYGVQGNVMAQVGNQSTSSIVLKDHKIDSEVSSVSFQGVDTKGNVRLPTATGRADGSAKAFTEAWESGSGFGFGW